ncbi:MAG: type I-E CRISPR-associated protein Cas7/Cse4/CasC [Gracilibacteraceae bacterium]|jgi:CRISPR system Cascade subunit CasC|nr:type I-E CRISPR-associated protein Cas7/Cse4/CasC [Gracilibacteraceae bacterium]
MATKRLFLDVHILQTVPPSCVNRDDTGSPKTAVYGGVKRARVSSQAWKRVTREAFRKGVEEGILDENYFGYLTKRKEELVASYITRDIDKVVAAQDILKAATAGTDALFFLSPAQAKALAALVDAGNFDINDAKEEPAKAEKKKLTKAEQKKLDQAEDTSKKEAAEAALKSAPSVDIALFGRMVANNSKLNVDASCQVAHAISTHKVENEYDYFTAKEDFPEEDKTDAGAAHIGTSEFNSSTLYRYATIALHDFEKQLGGEEGTITLADATKAFLQAFIRSMPKGSINSYANYTSPNYVMITLRSDTPVNLVGAFEKPVKASREDGGYMANSIVALKDKETKVYDNWYKAPDKDKKFVVCEDGKDGEGGKDGSLDEVIDKIGEAIKECFEDKKG